VDADETASVVVVVTVVFGILPNLLVRFASLTVAEKEEGCEKPVTVAVRPIEEARDCNSASFF